MREIEIKVRIADRQSIIDAITQRGTAVSAPVMQHDRVYGVPGVSGGEEQGQPWLRIRTETRPAETKDQITKHYFTLKKSITSQLDSIEHETEIADPAELAKIIQHLNFVPYSDLTKSRQKARIGEIEICIDHIDELGDFVEAEKLTPEDADYETVIAELWELLESLGAEKANQVTDGYDVLMNRHLGQKPPDNS